MRFNFDEQIDRRQTNSLKYDFAIERGQPADLLPLWVADMDFKTPPEVIAALVKSSEHGIFGYSDSKGDYFEALRNWFSTRFDWKIDPIWLVKTPGIVYAIATAVHSLTQPGDAILIQQPVYYPFSSVVKGNDRQLVINELLYHDGAYFIDFADFEAQIVANKVKLFIFCSPHNPVGRVWTREELIRLGDICIKHDVIIVSDEIHCDFVFPGHQHLILADLKPEFLAKTITCTAPSKTFNLAGLQVSNILIADPLMRRAFMHEIHCTGYSQLNTQGLVACQAAYTYGGPWLDELLIYLKGNLDYLRDFLAVNLPHIKLVEPEGTYLVWLDFSATGLSEAARQDLIINRAKLWLDAGSMFGVGGTHFERINIACPRQTLVKALQQLADAFK